MLATEPRRHSVRRRPANGGKRPHRRAHTRSIRSAESATTVTAKDRETAAASARAAGGRRTVRVRRGAAVRELRTAAGTSDGARPDAARPELDSAPESVDDPGGRLQLTLELGDPEPRGYEASGKPPRERIDFARWLWRAMSMGAATCPVLLGFQLVFTDPAHGLNVMAVVITMSFGTLFATWTIEYWLRHGNATRAVRAQIWTLTRHAVLASVGVAAMAVSALNGTASYGLLILVALTLIVADVVLRRLRIR